MKILKLTKVIHFLKAKFGAKYCLTITHIHTKQSIQLNYFFYKNAHHKYVWKYDRSCISYLSSKGKVGGK